MEKYQEYQVCRLCPRKCGVNRYERTGYCKVPAEMIIGRAALHMWEEPCISGEDGSGTIFFTGCNLGCEFCQNHVISKDKPRSENGKINENKLVDIMLSLQEQKANNINLVTASHYVPSVAKAIQLAKEQGLSIPIVYNTGSYERKETLKMLDGLVDIYLPDFKFMDAEVSRRYTGITDYADYAKEAVREMVRQAGGTEFDSRGIMTKGVIVRHLMLPGNFTDSVRILEYLHETYGNAIYISIMNQYTPTAEYADKPELNRKISRRTYDHLIDKAIQMGIENAFIQEGPTARDSFIPEFFTQKF